MPDHVCWLVTTLCVWIMWACVWIVWACVWIMWACVWIMWACVWIMWACVDHVTTDKLVSYILRGVLHPPVNSWPVHLLLHVLNNIVHTSHGNKPVLTLTLPVLLLCWLPILRTVGLVNTMCARENSVRSCFTLVGNVPWKRAAQTYHICWAKTWQTDKSYWQFS